jgi:hypothetical protein
MGRNAEIDAIVEAWYEAKHCAPPDRAKTKAVLDKLLDAALVKSKGLASRQQLLNWLWPRLQEYRKQKFKEQSVQVAQAAMKKT